MSKRMKSLLLAVLLGASVLLGACENPNLIDKIVSNRGHCAAESWGGHCD